MIVAVLLAATYLSLTTESFDTPRNLFNTTRNVTFFAIIAMGMTIVIITGGIDLSVGSVLCLCSMVIAVVMHGDIKVGSTVICAGGCNIYCGVGASILTALLVGAFNGVLVAYLGIPVLRRDPRHAVDRAQPRDDRFEQHDDLEVRARPRPAAAARRRRDLRRRQSGASTW